MTQPPPVPKEAAARAWSQLGVEPKPVTARTPAPAPAPAPAAPPRPPVERPPAPEPRTPTSQPQTGRGRGKVIAIAAAAAVAIAVVAALAVTGGDENPRGSAQGTGGSTKAGSPARVANASEIRNKFPLLAARLAPLNLQPTRKDPTVLPMPFELRPENTANGWQFTVSQPFAVRGVDPSKPIESPIGSTAYNDISVDGFAEAAGAGRMREAYAKLRQAQGHAVVQAGDGTAPARLQRDGNGFVTTTFLLTSGNVLVRFVNVCHQCSPDDVNRDVLPVVEVLRNLFPSGS